MEKCVRHIIMTIIYYFHNFVLISGTKHFLLMCSVRPEDSGEIKFVARHVESISYLEVEGILINDNILLGVTKYVHIYT